MTMTLHRIYDPATGESQKTRLSLGRKSDAAWRTGNGCWSTAAALVSRYAGDAPT